MAEGGEERLDLTELLFAVAQVVPSEVVEAES